MNAQPRARELRDELLDEYFSSKADLRHLAERVGYSFVPVDIVEESESSVVAILTPRGAPPVRVLGVREQAWQPFRITSVETA